MHALIIEDEPLIAIAIEDALRGCGFTSFDFAVTAEEALTAARRKCPDLITADVQLRPGCGITAVQSICSERPIPFIFITGTPDQVKTRVPEHALVEKPFRADHIVDAVNLIFQLRSKTNVRIMRSGFVVLREGSQMSRPASAIMFVSVSRSTRRCS